MFTNEQKKICLQIARESIAKKLKLISEIIKCPDDVIFTQLTGLFVTLHKNVELRGCIGCIKPINTLYESLIELAHSAAFLDDRFPPVRADEFDSLHIEISILSPLKVVEDQADIVVGKDGLLIIHKFHTGLLLPQVATQYNWDRETFLHMLCRKAGLDKSCLEDKDLKLYSFECEIFSENLSI
jgi:AmmeMemoRadiSam system protein A